ncbi:MAG: L,D-transpeptidase family protein [Marinobacter sp.]|uniref:L,D-transpeptidase family protein n=1 Tax=Marinobacter sp. TaxID=50741 RepID=UPI00329724AE
MQTLKARLSAQGYLQHPSRGGSGNPGYYAAATADAITRFQADFSLTQDGRAGRATIQALNRQPADLLATLRANLERLRWPFNQPVDRGLVVDIASAEATLYDKGKAVWHNRVQVGKPGRETPELRSLITHFTLYPAWNIPKSIFVNDMLPRIMSDPGYLQRRNIRVLDHSGNELPPEPAYWPSPASMRLQQQPGPSNPLGSIAIRFSNPFEVYLHDTPAGELFSSPERFYSNGCVRVEDVESLAGTLFGLHSWRTEKPFDERFANSETRNVRLPRSVPILMTYRTAINSEESAMRFRSDRYRRDRYLISLLDRQEPAR